jgi:hypothetical protein
MYLVWDSCLKFCLMPGDVQKSFGSMTSGTQESSELQIEV